MMKSRKEQYPEQAIIRDEKYLQWKRTADKIISSLKNELEHDLKNPYVWFFGDANALLEHHNTVDNVFKESLSIAQEVTNYFIEKQKTMIPIIEEYERVSLDDKDENYLKTFRSRIGEHIRKYSADAKRLGDFSKEFQHTFEKIAKKWFRLNYLHNQHTTRQEIAACFAQLELRMDAQITLLQSMRLQAFHLMKNSKEEIE